jgi:hypothetical protein
MLKGKSFASENGFLRMFGIFATGACFARDASLDPSVPAIKARAGEAHPADEVRIDDIFLKDKGIQDLLGCRSDKGPSCEIRKQEISQ